MEEETVENEKTSLRRKTQMCSPVGRGWQERRREEAGYSNRRLYRGKNDPCRKGERVGGGRTREYGRE